MRQGILVETVKMFILILKVSAKYHDSEKNYLITF